MTTFNSSDKSSSVTLSGGNLVLSVTSGGVLAIGGARGNTSKTTGKVFCEFTYTNSSLGGTKGFWAGIAQNTASLDGPVFGGSTDYGAENFVSGSDAFISPEGGSPSSSSSFVTNDVIGIAVDIGNGLAWVAKNGTWLDFGASDDPNTGTGGVAIATGVTWYPVAGIYATSGTGTMTANFGGSAFAYSVPTGFSAWDAAATNIPAIMKYLRDQGLA